MATSILYIFVDDKLENSSALMSALRALNEEVLKIFFKKILKCHVLTFKETIFNIARTKRTLKCSF